MRKWTLLAGAGMGAVLMYVFDPEKGRRRRALLRDRLAAVAQDGEDAVEKTLRDLNHRAGGLGARIVRFDRNPDATTRVTVRMSYNPPGGALGHIVATLFGSDPKRAMDDDLVRFESPIEEGKTTAHGETVASQEIVAEERGQIA